ncbi:MAG: PAS domain S-box-containing protein [Phenylobacterium sp.]|jgi:PAS domain S-box-containing protein
MMKLSKTDRFFVLYVVIAFIIVGLVALQCTTHLEKSLVHQSALHTAANISHQSCVGCHNSRPDAQTSDSNVDDLPAEVEVQIPLTVATTQIHSMISRFNVIIIAAGAVFMLVLLLAVLRLRHHAIHLQTRITERTKSLGAQVEEKINAQATANVLVESLEYAANFNHNIIQATHDTFLILAIDGKIETANEAALNLLGYEALTLHGQSFKKIIAKEDINKLFNDTGEVTIERIQELQLNYLSRDGKKIPMLFSSSAIHDSNGLLSGIVCTAQDITERIAAETALKKSKEKLDAIINTTVDAIITIDEHGIIDTFNLSAEKMFGYSAAEAFGQNINILMPEPHHHQHNNYLKDYCATGDSEVMGTLRELEGKHQSGRIFPMELSVSDALVDNQRIFTGVIRDLTKSKRIEKERYNLSKYLDTIFLNLPMGIAILEGPQFKYFRINKTLADLNGLSIGAHLGKPLADILPAAQYTLVPELKRVLASGQAILQREFSWPSPTDVNKSLNLLDWHIPIKSSDGEITSIVSVVMDISERKQAEDALKERVKYEQMINEVSSGLVTMGINELNRGIKQALAITGEFCGVDRAYVFELVDDGKIMSNTHEWCTPKVAKVKKRRQSVHLDQQLPWFIDTITQLKIFDIADVTTLPVEARLELAHFEDHGVKSILVLPMVVGDRIIGFIGFDSVLVIRKWTPSDHFVLRMVGEMLGNALQHRQAEQTIRRIQKLDAIGQLTGGIAHDFNNILGVIMGNLELLGMGLANDTTAKGVKANRQITNAGKAVARAAQLTKQLLGVARREPTSYSTVNINDVITDMNALISNSLGEHIHLCYDLEQQLWLTDIDPGDLQDAMLNLMLNARDAMPGGGDLTLQTGNYILDKDYCVLNPGCTPGEYVQIIITDCGEGIPKAQQQRIFEPFYTTKPPGKGTGLGLAMVFGFIKRSKGYIKVYSELGLGTSFRLYLPRSTNEQKKLESQQHQSPELPRGNETLLIVDDERGLVELVEENLKRLGYHIRTASTGPEALAQLANAPTTTLMFSDVVMPGGIDGYQLAEQASASYPDLKILLTSGFTEKSQSSHNRHQGFAFIGKPYNQAELAIRIRETIDAQP